MIKHIILWNIKDTFSTDEKETIKQNVKENLESLSGKIPGMLDIKVRISGLASSTADLMLDSSFETEDDLKAYAVHPDHVNVADTYVRPFMSLRSCLDFEVK